VNARVHNGGGKRVAGGAAREADPGEAGRRLEFTGERGYRRHLLRLRTIATGDPLTLEKRTAPATYAVRYRWTVWSFPD